MKSITERIIESLKEKQKSFIGTNGETARQDFKDGIGWAIGCIEGCLTHCEFEEIARELVKYLAEQHHPHHTAIVTSTGAELTEGVRSTGKIMDYIKD